MTAFVFSYQSECHCAKTYYTMKSQLKSLVTSQNVTAPKLVGFDAPLCNSLVTSQNVTAPKRWIDNATCG